MDWATRIAGSGVEAGTGISINNSSEIVCIGEYLNSPAIVYDTDGQIRATLANDGGSDYFIVKYR